MSLGHSKISLHELTALQVDINNRRTKAMPPPFKQASGKRDRMGNFIASRPFAISKKRPMSPDDEVDSPGRPSNYDSAEWKEEDDGPRKKKRKKRHFSSDVLPFLHPPPSQRKATDTPTGNNDELPSSDLLKMIHHFASTYYEERGILVGSSRTWRRKKYNREANRWKRGKGLTDDYSKTRWKSSNSKADKATTNEEREDAIEEDEDEEIEDEDEEETEEEDEVDGDEYKDTNSDDSDSTSVEEREAIIRHQPTHMGYEKDAGLKPKRRPKGIVDMYRAFDGSALLCIGVLLQSLVTSRIDRTPPDMAKWISRLSEEQEQKRQKRGKKVQQKSGDSELMTQKPQDRSPSEDEDGLFEGEDSDGDDDSSAGSRQSMEHNDGRDDEESSGTSTD